MTRTRRYSTIRPFDLRAVRRAHGPYAVAGAVRVLVVDDHLAVRLGLAGLLDEEDGIELVGLSTGAREGLIESRAAAPDVAVVDYQLGRGEATGSALRRELRQLPRPPSVLIYSAYADSVPGRQALVAGADGVMSKGSLGTEVSWAIHAVAHGRRVLPRSRPRRRLPEGAPGSADQAILGMLLEDIDEDEISPARVGRRRPGLALAVRRRARLDHRPSREPRRAMNGPDDGPSAAAEPTYAGQRSRRWPGSVPPRSSASHLARARLGRRRRVRRRVPDRACALAGQRRGLPAAVRRLRRCAGPSARGCCGGASPGRS